MIGDKHALKSACKRMIVATSGSVYVMGCADSAAQLQVGLLQDITMLTHLHNAYMCKPMTSVMQEVKMNCNVFAYQVLVISYISSTYGLYAF